MFDTIEALSSIGDSTRECDWQEIAPTTSAMMASKERLRLSILKRCESGTTFSSNIVAKVMRLLHGTKRENHSREWLCLKSNSGRSEYVVSFTPGFSQVSRGAKSIGNRLNGFQPKHRLVTWLKPGVNKRGKVFLRQSRRE